MTPLARKILRRCLPRATVAAARNRHDRERLARNPPSELAHAAEIAADLVLLERRSEAALELVRGGACLEDALRVTTGLRTYQREPDRSRFAMSCPGGERTVLFGAVYRVDGFPDDSGARNMRVIDWGQKRTSNHKTFRMENVATTSPARAALLSLAIYSPDEIRAAWTPEKPVTWSRIGERVLLGADGFYRPMHPTAAVYPASIDFADLL